MLRNRLSTLVALSPTGQADKRLVTLCCQLDYLKNTIVIKHFRTTSKKSRIFEVPSETEASNLKSVYVQPKKIITDLLKPLVLSGKITEPRVEFVPKLNGLYWKAQLHIKWPHPITFAGTHSCINQAEENAYLLACQLFQNVGLLYSCYGYRDIQPVSEAHVFEMLETMANISRQDGYQDGPFYLKSARCYKDGKVGWQSVLTVPWPHYFSVTDHAPTIQASHYSVCLLASIKLKVLHLLRNDNNLAQGKVIEMARHQLKYHNYPSAQEIDPHYQIYVDASRVGFGAYLLNKSENKVRWMSESWNEHFKASPVLNDRLHRIQAFMNHTR